MNASGESAEDIRRVRKHKSKPNNQCCQNHNSNEDWKQCEVISNSSNSPNKMSIYQDASEHSSQANDLSQSYDQLARCHNTTYDKWRHTAKTLQGNQIFATKRMVDFRTTKSVRNFQRLEQNWQVKQNLNHFLNNSSSSDSVESDDSQPIELDMIEVVISDNL